MTRFSNSRSGTSHSLASRLKIGTRIYAGFAVVLVLFGISAVLGHSGISDATGQFNTFAWVSDRTITGETMTSRLNALRARVLLFNFAGDKTALNGVPEEAQKLVKDAGDAAASSTDPKVKEQLTNLRDMIQAYFADADQANDIRAKSDKIRTDISVVGPKMIAVVGTLYKATVAAHDFEGTVLASAAMQDLLSARLSAARYTIFTDLAEVDRAKQFFTAMQKDIASLSTHLTDPQLGATANDAKGLIDQYLALFNGSTALDVDHNKLIRETMPQLADKITTLAADISTTRRTALEQLHQSGSAVLSSTATWASVIFVVALLLGILFAWITARSIVRPAVAMTDIMGRLADHDLAAEVTGIDRKDEIGAMANAVQVFKDNMIKADAMAEAQKSEQAAKEERARKVNALTADFDTSIGNVVQAVSDPGRADGDLGPVAVVDRRGGDQAVVRRGRRLGGGLGQRSDGGIGDRGALLLDRRDQPPGGPVEPRSRPAR